MKKILLVICTFVFANSVLASEGITSLESNYSVKVTADRFEEILKSEGLTLFARVDHSQNASTVSLELAPTEVIVFGNPMVGTPLMQCSKSVAIDLPQKALFWEDSEGKVFLSYNNPQFLKERHSINGCESVINQISGVLDKLSKAAVSK